MTKARRDSSTLDLFDIPQPIEPVPGALNYSIELRHELSAALKETPLSRYQIAARMSELLGVEISKSTIDAWTAESREPWRFPFEYAASFEVACGTTRLQALLSRKRGSKVLVGEDAILAELGRINHMKADLARQEKLIRAYLHNKK